MANPVLQSIDDASADALSGTTRADVGAKYLTKLAGPSDVPSAFTQLLNMLAQTWTLLARNAQGAVIPIGSSGLNVGAFGLEYEIAGVAKSYAGDASFACTPSSTNYLYVDTDETLKKSTTGWPAGAHYKLAIVVTDGSNVLSITEARHKNHPVGILGDWWTMAAAAKADLGGFGIANVGALELDDAEATISGGLMNSAAAAITRVDTEGDAASDTLNRMDPAGVTEGKRVILRAENAARVVTIAHAAGGTGQFDLHGEASFVLDDAAKMIEVIGRNGSWVEIARHPPTISALQGDLNASNNSVIGIKRFNLNGSLDSTIAAGSIAFSASLIELLNESAAATDDLNTISGGSDGDLLLIKARTNAQVPTLKHGTGNLILKNGADYELTNTDRFILLVKWSSNWQEVSRSHGRLDELVGTGSVIPFPITAHRVGTAGDGDIVLHMVCEVAMTVTGARGYAGTAPSGGNCVVHIDKNGSSIFAADANAINIADGTNSDDSDAVSESFAPGDRLSVRIKTASTAANVGVLVKARAAATA